MRINAKQMHFHDLNQTIRQSSAPVIEADGVCGQRYLGCALKGRELILRGTPGNALGAYLDGGRITVYGTAQDAVGDTMNDGEIVIHGNAGDAAGYAMRGGRILISGDAGYRAGIHMKAYADKEPALVVGGSAGSFLGEYQAGGVIVVLGLGSAAPAPVGFFCGAGMHGGKIFLRCPQLPRNLPEQVLARPAAQEELAALLPHLRAFQRAFHTADQLLFSHPFYVLTPNTRNPYHRLYTLNQG